MANGPFPQRPINVPSFTGLGGFQAGLAKERLGLAQADIIGRSLGGAASAFTEGIREGRATSRADEQFSTKRADLLASKFLLDPETARRVVDGDLELDQAISESPVAESLQDRELVFKRELQDLKLESELELAEKKSDIRVGAEKEISEVRQKARLEELDTRRQGALDNLREGLQAKVEGLKAVLIDELKLSPEEAEKRIRSFVDKEVQSVDDTIPSTTDLIQEYGGKAGEALDLFTRFKQGEIDRSELVKGLGTLGPTISERRIEAALTKEKGIASRAKDRLDVRKSQFRETQDLAREKFDEAKKDAKRAGGKDFVNALLKVREDQVDIIRLVTAQLGEDFSDEQFKKELPEIFEIFNNLKTLESDMKRLLAGD